MARLNEYKREMQYRFYLSSLAQGYLHIETSYADMIGLKKDDEPQMSGDEIAASILKKGLHFKKKEVK